MKRLFVASLLAASFALCGSAPLPPARPLSFSTNSRPASAYEALEAAMQDLRGSLAGTSEDDWRALAQRFEALEGPLRGSAWEARAELARLDCLARAGLARAASPRYAAIASEPNVPDWALFVCAHGLESSDPGAAKRAYQSLLEAHPRSVLGDETRYSLGKLLLKSDPLLAARYLREVAARGEAEPLAEKAVFLLGTEGPKPERSAWLRVYRARYAAGPNKLAVARALSREAGLSDSERLALAGDLLEDADYGPAEQLLTGLNSGLALFRMGRAAWRKGAAERGIALLKRAMAADPDLKSKTFVVLAQIEEKRKLLPLAIAYYRQAADDPGQAGLEALDKLGILYRKGDDDPNAQAVDYQIIARYPDSDKATEARWRFLWRSYQAKHFDEAKRWASRMGYETLVKVEGPGGAYWLGRLQEREGQATMAAETYQEVLRRSPRSYYGWRARFRLAAIESGRPDPGFAVHRVQVQAPREDLTSLVDPRAGRSHDPRTAAYVRALAAFPTALRELVYLGHVGPAQHDARRHGTSPDLSAWLALQAGRYAESIQLSRGEDPYLSYPLGFYPYMKAAAEPQRIDPLLLTSLVKQESLFDPRARSWVGAMGLSQLMPFTADWVAKHVPGPARGLSDPFWNLKIGAYYLAYVQHKLLDQPVFAVAAYNAGPNAVKKWMAQFGDQDVDAWVELIPFPETRHYVKKVFCNLWTYQRLYGR